MLRVKIKCLPWNYTTLTESKPMHILKGLPGSGGVLGAGGVPGAGTGLVGGTGGMWSNLTCNRFFLLLFFC